MSEARKFKHLFVDILRQRIVTGPYRLRRAEFIDMPHKPARRNADARGKMSAVEIRNDLEHIRVTGFRAELFRQQRPAALTLPGKIAGKIRNRGLSDLGSRKIFVERGEYDAERSALTLPLVTEIAPVDKRLRSHPIDGAVDAENRPVIEKVLAAFGKIALEIPRVSATAFASPDAVLLGIKRLYFVFLPAHGDSQAR